LLSVDADQTDFGRSDFPVDPLLLFECYVVSPDNEKYGRASKRNPAPQA
jgi:hypothetical protein